MKITLKFLKELSANNNREWFQQNKAKYEASQDEMVAFADSLLTEMNKVDVIATSSGNRSLHRIYRDVRFRKDKTPYKTNRSGFFTRDGAERRGGYYFHISPKETFIMGGFFGSNAEDLLHIRNQISAYSDPLRQVLASDEFKNTFGTLQGEQLKSSPRGFPKDHEEIDLLRYKQFIVRKDFTKKEVLSKGFHVTMAAGLSAMLPFFEVMTDYLTTDLNGEPIFGI